MAKSQYEYVKQFEQNDALLRHCFIVVRVDGHAFHRFVVEHGYERPNDVRGLSLMNRAAQAVMQEFRDIVLGYGESDEYSFLFKRDTVLYGRRASKLSTYVASLFTAAFMFHWKEFFPTGPEIRYPPCYDARAVCYPTVRTVRDYFCWRQADCHINNLYNTCFWALVQQQGLTPKDAEKALCGTDSGQKNELLFSTFGVNYAKLPAMFRKGSVLVWDIAGRDEEVSHAESISLTHGDGRQTPFVLHVDIIGPAFWKAHPKLLPQD